MGETSLFLINNKSPGCTHCTSVIYSEPKGTHGTAPACQRKPENLWLLAKLDFSPRHGQCCHTFEKWASNPARSARWKCSAKWAWQHNEAAICSCIGNTLLMFWLKHKYIYISECSRELVVLFNSGHGWWGCTSFIIQRVHLFSPTNSPLACRRRLSSKMHVLSSPIASWYFSSWAFAVFIKYIF